MTKMATWEQIAGDLDQERDYLLERCLRAEGKDPNDQEAMLALIADAQAVWQA